jgi:hypothetical protein
MYERPYRIIVYHYIDISYKEYVFQRCFKGKRVSAIIIEPIAKTGYLFYRHKGTDKDGTGNQCNIGQIDPADTPHDKTTIFWPWFPEKRER